MSTTICVLETCHHRGGCWVGADIEWKGGGRAGGGVDTDTQPDDCFTYSESSTFAKVCHECSEKFREESVIRPQKLQKSEDVSRYLAQHSRREMGERGRHSLSVGEGGLEEGRGI